MILTRRNFFGLLAAPAIIRVATLMPVRAFAEPAPVGPDLRGMQDELWYDDSRGWAQQLVLNRATGQYEEGIRLVGSPVIPYRSYPTINGPAWINADDHTYGLLRNG